MDKVKPGGTGNPNFAIWAKFAPFPPRISLELKALWVPPLLNLKITFSNYAPSTFEKSIKLLYVLQNICNNSKRFFFISEFSSFTITLSKKLSVVDFAPANIFNVSS